MPEEWAQKAASGDGLSLGSLELLGLPVDHCLAKLEEKENRNTKPWTGNYKRRILELKNITTHTKRTEQQKEKAEESLNLKIY